MILTCRCCPPFNSFLFVISTKKSVSLCLEGILFSMIFCILHKRIRFLMGRKLKVKLPPIIPSHLMSLKNFSSVRVIWVRVSNKSRPCTSIRIQFSNALRAVIIMRCWSFILVVIWCSVSLAQNVTDPSAPKSRQKRYLLLWCMNFPDCCDFRGRDVCGFACPKCPIKLDMCK